uniref:baseplate J/gp47 family protein n=1 Tax=Megamonas sp. TaxID=2049033 RepID=UPI00258D04FB
TKIPMSIYGVSAVTNKNSAYDGFDEETDEELLERLLFKVQKPATSGNPYHYVQWATEVTGVGGVKVIRLWNGPGTVKVIITDANNGIASEDLIEKVKNHIEEQRPIGATVTVVSLEPVKINIELKVTSGTASIEGIKNAVNDYFKKNIFNATYVSYAVIGGIILNNSATTGVLDYTDLKINNNTENVPLTDEQMPTVNEVKIIE